MSVDSLRSSDHWNFYNRALSGTHCSKTTSWELMCSAPRAFSLKLHRWLKLNYSQHIKVLSNLPLPHVVSLFLFFFSITLSLCCALPLLSPFFGVQPRSKVDRRIPPWNVVFWHWGLSGVRIHWSAAAATVLEKFSSKSFWQKSISISTSVPWEQPHIDSAGPSWISQISISLWPVLVVSEQRVDVIQWAIRLHRNCCAHLATFVFAYLFGLRALPTVLSSFLTLKQWRAAGCWAVEQRGTRLKGGEISTYSTTTRDEQAKCWYTQAKILGSSTETDRHLAHV